MKMPLSEWRAAQPKPPKPKRRRQSRAFESWRRHCEAYGRIPFSDFLKELWPQWRWHTL